MDMKSHIKLTKRSLQMVGRIYGGTPLHANSRNLSVKQIFHGKLNKNGNIVAHETQLLFILKAQGKTS